MCVLPPADRADRQHGSQPCKYSDAGRRGSRFPRTCALGGRAEERSCSRFKGSRKPSHCDTDSDARSSPRPRPKGREAASESMRLCAGAGTTAFSGKQPLLHEGLRRRSGGQDRAKKQLPDGGRDGGPCEAEAAGCKPDVVGKHTDRSRASPPCRRFALQPSPTSRRRTAGLTKGVSGFILRVHNLRSATASSHGASRERAISRTDSDFGFCERVMSRGSCAARSPPRDRPLRLSPLGRAAGVSRVPEVGCERAAPEADRGGDALAGRAVEIAGR